jgi:hypothetical protein
MPNHANEKITASSELWMYGAHRQQPDPTIDSFNLLIR